jgi:hypothetical protein
VNVNSTTNRHSLGRWLAAGALLTLGGSVFGQAPAVRLLPAIPTDDIPATVVRAATPAPEAPAPKPTVTPPAPEKRKGLMESLFAPKAPAPASAPTGEEKPWWPQPEEQPLMAKQAGTRPTYAQPNGANGVYAGTPAYRWYGYGGPTPGANPNAPNGLYPKGSANWYSQTGATPGAFPLPTSVAQRAPSYEPPTFITQPAQDSMTVQGQRVVANNVERAEPEAAPQRRTEFGAPTTVANSIPQMPQGAGQPLATSARQEAPRRTDETIWSASTTRRPQQAPIASSNAPPLTLVESQSKTTTQPVTPAVPDTTWGPSRVPVITEPSRTPTTPPQVTMSRGQAPLDETPDLGKLIRQVSFGRAEKVLVSATGKNSLHVNLSVTLETDARDVAALISRLPELKEYAITFEAHLVK